MSTQKWESVTWDWLEREIVDCLLIAGERRQELGSLDRLLKEPPNQRSSSAISARKQTGERTNA